MVVLVVMAVAVVVVEGHEDAKEQKVEAQEHA